ncbi:RHS repeat-associated core domain-containing protein [Shewanella scandinavica]|uniref:RHS repeat-associated core domain-containing protein n=1 Tax=Shewanella scandinavica TaxID=3063538 RepID=A0ABU3G278_9GAMM|nr:RHS repeat-associated core domain-containing protein [Shewanella sp. SP2S1-2]MDT3281738.1 RHS repeat-associated core domain-containing protein [Shewanella sp. SP2S1-2]
MLPLWTLRRKSSFAAFMLLLCLVWMTDSYAVLPPGTPSLSGSKVNTMVNLRWNINCDVTTVNIQESTDGNIWNTVYRGLGDPVEDTSPPPILMSFSPVFGGDTGTVCPGWTSARDTYLAGKSISSYYYRINACISSACSTYSAAIIVGNPSAPTTPTIPTSISAPATNATGAFSVSWSSVNGAARYELQQRVNGGAWVAKYSGTATNYALSGLTSGTYQYQVRACTTACSAWKLSSNTQVTLPLLGSDWKNLSRVSVADAGGSDTAPSDAVDLNAASVKGQAGVSGGQASYQIPIDLPPGRNGVQPSVSLSYNSQGGNGILGVGWSLNAGSSISRCGATFAQDGFTRAVTFNATTDRLCLDGQRLIAITGTYGTGNTEYRTEMDSFVKVVQHGNINDSNSRFTVYKPDGNSATYGTKPDSHSSPNGGLTRTLNWKVTQESSSNGMNTIDYEYDNSVKGENLLSTIYYTGSNGSHGDRRVEFEYEMRTDEHQSYMRGGLLLSTRRLHRIHTYAEQGEALATFKFEYSSSQATSRSLLRNVSQCDAKNIANQCTPLTQFSWLDSAINYQTDPTPVKSQRSLELVLPSGDRNGDGSTDWPNYNVNAEGEFSPSNATIDNCFFNKLTSAMQCHNADINLDGKTDPVIIDWAKNLIKYAISINGNLVWKNTDIVVSSRSSSIVHIGDMNGDGYPDLVMLHYDYNQSEVYFYPHSRNISQPYSNARKQKLFTLKNVDGNAKDNFSFVGDIDGNGFGDFIYATSGNGYNGLRPFNLLLVTPDLQGWLNLSVNPLNFEDDSHYDQLGNGWMRFQIYADINGDGLNDWLGFYKPDINGSKLFVRLNKGGFFDEPKETGQTLNTRSFVYNESYGTEDTRESIWRTVPYYADSFRVMDVNGDGRDEIIFPKTRVITACYKMMVFKTTKVREAKEICGDDIYNEIYPLKTKHSLQSVNEQFDYSIYRYAVLKFDETDATLDTSLPLYGAATHTALIDAFGNGLADIVFNYGCGTTECRFIAGNVTNLVPGQLNLVRNYGAGSGASGSDYQPVDYLQSVTDGLGNNSEWRYRPLSTGEGSAGQSKLYTTDHDEVGTGYVHFASSMYVVQSFKQSNGQIGENEIQYAYKGAMYHLQGRGFTGFNQIWEKDMQRDKTVHSVFEQKFPRVGLLTSQTVTVGSTTVNQVNNTWVDNPLHKASLVRSKGVYHNIQTSSLQRSWDLDGILMSEIKQTVGTGSADVDEWGNIKKHTQKLTDYIKGQANTYTNTTETSFAVDTSNWWLNKFNEIRTSHDTVQRAWGDDPVGTNDKAQWQLQTVNTWDNVHKLPTQVTYTASNTSCNRVEQTGLNSYGLPLWTKSTGQSSACTAITARQNNFTYTKDGKTQVDDGYLPYKVTNAKGHITTTEYDMGLGLPTKVVAPNNIVTQTEYDGIGRPVQVKQTGSPTRYLRYLLANEGNNAPQDNDNVPVVMTRTSGAGMPESEQYFDGQGRLLRTATQGFDGDYQYQDKHYDALGRMTRDSTPYGNGTSADYTEFSDFDALDRPIRRTIPNGRSGGLESIYTYNGLTTNINVEGRTMSRTYGSQGWLYETVDAQDGTNRFAYDGAGRPLVIRDANYAVTGKDIKATYNGFGHKTQVIDPNQGTTVFGYNTLGELDKQTDANGVVQTYVLDVLGRITSKTTTGGSAPGQAVFYWDGNINNDAKIEIIGQLGLLTSETENGVTRNYSYTAALQLAQTTIAVDGTSRTVKHQYDGFYGRPKALEYPNGLTLKYGYNDYGYLEQTSNAASGYLYRQITAMDEAGHITGANLANRVMSESRVYYSEGTMSSVEVDGPLGLIHGHYYDGYDDFMNLTSERNGVTGLVKSYRYDSLNRLEEYQFNNTNPNFTATVNYAYDKVGNFLKKTDYSANATNAYRYGGNAGCAANSNAGPNAVCQLNKLNGSTVNFQYDKRGNLRVGDGLTMTYNAMDKPLTISGRGPNNNTLTAFVYGSDSMRAKQSRTVSGSTTTTYYVDKYYEIDNDGSWRAYLDDIAVLSYTPQRSHLLQFTLRDRLGSATTMADQNGNIVSQRYFDPFGRTTDLGYNHKLDIQNKNTLLSQLQDLAVTNKNRRGFTDHEHLNEQQLIHMNGRIYDYNLGRFMSVDPFIQSPTSTQSVNPYSYIMNNPLAGTDPTGYLASCRSATSHICTTKNIQYGDGIFRENSNAKTLSEGIANGASKVQSPSFTSIANAGSLQQNAVKQNPSYGNDPNFAKGYGSLKGDMSGILSMTGPALAVDAVKAGIETASAIADEYEQSGLSMSTFIIAGKAAGEAAIDVGAKKFRLPGVASSAKEVKNARQRGVNGAKSAERDLVKSGHPGTADSGGWSFAERKRIAETGQFPSDTRWHHINDVKRNPGLADVADNVTPSRGGNTGHVSKYHPNGTQAGSSGSMLNRSQLNNDHMNGN